jgi:8-oxo-dGTP pyrophosphatase MutT (NUDIX family)
MDSGATSASRERSDRIRSAATVMLVRDRPRLEVFVLRRTPRAVFGPGATVFPGGAVDASDAAALGRVVGIDDPTASAELGLSEGGLVRRVAAVRECLEEAGILLARDASSGAHAAPPVEWRDALNAGHATLAHVLDDLDLVIDAADLQVFAHWLTPVGAPRRYDTWFFVARAPQGQDGAHDDAELVASEWTQPRTALLRYQRGEIDLVLPTLRTLEALGRFETVEALFDALARVPRDAHGRLGVVAEGSGERVWLPGDATAPSGPWTIPLPDIHFDEELRIAVGSRGDR